MPKRLAIVIVNYNTRELLAGCLNSVFAARFSHPFEVVLVDNCSSDGSAAEVRSSFPQVALLETERNGGFGYANNIALRWLAQRAADPAIAPSSSGPAAGQQPPGEVVEQGDAGLLFDADYILLLNPDTVLPDDALQLMVSFMEEHPAAGVVGPRMVKLDGKLDLACRRSFPTPLNSLFKLTGIARLLPNSKLVAQYNLTNLPEDQLTEVDAVMGAFMLLRATAVGQAGLFDERFFMYGEDLDLCYRIKERGWKVFYNPAASVLHLKGASSRKRSARSIREFYRAMHIFYAKHYAARYGRLVSLLVRSGITLRGILALTQNAFRSAEQKRVT